MANPQDYSAVSADQLAASSSSVSLSAEILHSSESSDSNGNSYYSDEFHRDQAEDSNLDSCSEMNQNQCAPLVPVYDVPVQKSRLRSEESVFSCKDVGVCLCSPRQNFVEWHYKTTRYVTKNLREAVDGLNFDNGGCDRRQKGFLDGSLRSSRASSTSSREFFRAYPMETCESDSSGYSRRQGTIRRTVNRDATLRPKLKRSPEPLTYLCVRVIDENVMRCEATFSDCSFFLCTNASVIGDLRFIDFEPSDLRVEREWLNRE